MALQDFLSSLIAAKKEIQRPELPSREDQQRRLRKLASLLGDHRETLTGLDPAASSFTPEFYQEQIWQPFVRSFENAASEVASETVASAFPTGVIGLGIRSPLFVRLLGEKLPRAWAAGNAVLWQPTAEQREWAQHFEKIASAAGYPSGVLQLLPSGEDVTQLLFQHPGVKGLCWLDPALNPEMLGAPSAWFEKKWQLHRGGKATALVLADADLAEAAKGILRSVREGWGQTSWNLSRVLVIESVADAFFEEWRRELKAVVGTLPRDLVERRDFWTQKLRAEQARVIDPESAIAALENVSNCTEAHQLELQAPVVFTTTIKYPADATKWVNNLPNVTAVQIWGSDEKAQRIGDKLEAARIWIRRGMKPDDALWRGVKSSTFGTRDERIFGEFFSEPRFFDPDPSKESH